MAGYARKNKTRRNKKNAVGGARKDKRSKKNGGARKNKTRKNKNKKN